MLAWLRDRSGRNAAICETKQRVCTPTCIISHQRYVISGKGEERKGKRDEGKVMCSPSQCCVHDPGRTFRHHRDPECDGLQSS